MTAQVNTTLLDENNVGATLSDGGIFFSGYDINSPDQSMSLLGYEFLKGSGKYAMNGLSLCLQVNNVSTKTYRILIE